MIILKNKLGMIKSVELGFCWLTFFFGIFVPLLRGMTKVFFTWLGVAILMGIVLPYPITIIGGVAYNIYMCTVMNEKYVEHLVSKGYEPIKEDVNNEN